MGQYYKAVNASNMEWVEPHDFDNGAKLMEHSYIGNSFVEAVEFLLIDDGEGNRGRWSGNKIVWAGDYANGEPLDGNNLYSLAEEKDKLKMLIEAVPPNYHYLVNWDKKQFVDKTKCNIVNGFWNTADMKIHPLPLLTADGNGRGGGDYHGNENSMEYVGTWARDRISLMKDIPEDFTEIIPNFDEDSL
jgi:hypothetical protein